MTELLQNSPVILGLVTFLLMYCDWLLTIAQERERIHHYSEHYQSYPTSTIEGNPMLRKEAARLKLLSPRHLVAAVLVSLLIAWATPRESATRGELLLGFVWGMFLIVNMQHLSNLIGYRAGRKGTHGKIHMHLRTGYKTQAGRYFSLSLFLLVLSFLSRAGFIYGVTAAGFLSSLRQLVWMLRTPKIGADEPPVGFPNDP